MKSSRMSLIVCRSIDDMGVDSKMWTFVSASPKTFAACVMTKAGAKRTSPIASASIAPT